jgi:hypothetical protein
MRFVRRRPYERRVVLDESGGPVEGGVALVEQRGECLEDVRDAGVMSRMTATSSAAAFAARRVASSRSTSWDPARISSGGSPNESARWG